MNNEINIQVEQRVREIMKENARKGAQAFKRKYSPEKYKEMQRLSVLKRRANKEKQS